VDIVGHLSPAILASVLGMKSYFLLEYFFSYTQVFYTLTSLLFKDLLLLSTQLLQITERSRNTG